jgi:hypothetical protein
MSHRRADAVKEARKNSRSNSHLHAKHRYNVDPVTDYRSHKSRIDRFKYSVRVRNNGLGCESWQRN